MKKVLQRRSIRRHFLAVGFGALVWMLFVGGCVIQPVRPEADMASEAAPSSALTADQLANLAYAIPIVDSEPIQLVDGRYEDTANRITVHWSDTYALGTLDGAQAAAVVLNAETGGSGIFSYLALVENQADGPVNTAGTLLGDRVKINWITVADDEIVVDLVTQGPDEPMCCGTQRTIARYAMEEGELVSTTTEVAGTQSPITTTQVITYIPTVIPTDTQSGSCFTNAIGLGRADAWRCMTDDNQIYDPCFQLDSGPASAATPTLICGADPVTDATGFVLALTEPLPTPDIGQLAMPWILLLQDGTRCERMTGTIPGVGEQVAPYGCDDGQTYLMADLQIDEPVWFAQRVAFDLGEQGFSIRASALNNVAAVWR